MTVKELIERLKQFPQDVPVCLADWNEGYREPDENAASIIALFQSDYYCPDQEPYELKKGAFVMLGSDEIYFHPPLSAIQRKE